MEIFPVGIIAQLKYKWSIEVNHAKKRPKVGVLEKIHVGKSETWCGWEQSDILSDWTIILNWMWEWDKVVLTLAAVWRIV